MPAPVSTTRAPSVRVPSGRHPFVARVRKDWRALTGGRATRDQDRRTLVACSGGADSCALVLALAGVRAGPVVAHVVHDLRPQPETVGDRDAVRELAADLGLDFAEASVRVAHLRGNAEANARRARYEALEQLSAQTACSFVATGHHADDQLETLLMRLLRGAGPQGLSGIAPSRAMGGTTLVRPMLGLSRSAGEALCSHAGVTWRTDATNADESRLRAAIRARVGPELLRLSPTLPESLARTTQTQREVAALLDTLAELALAAAHRTARSISVPLDLLLEQHPAVLAAVLRAAACELAPSASLDQLTRRVLQPVLEPVQEQRSIDTCGFQIVRTPHAVRITAR